ncbi:MAG: GNAT family N-acetyltransferase [Pseudomonadota bacterium]
MRPLPIEPLETDRLALRAPAAADVDDIVRYVGDIDVAGRLSRVPHPYTQDDAAYFLRELVPKATVWAVERREDSAFIGVISLSPHDGAADAELGYWFGKPFWGKGYATEAAGAVVAYADASGLTLLHSGFFEFNPASGRVLRKVGFEEAGRSTRPSAADGEEHRHVDMLRKRGAPTA